MTDHTPLFFLFPHTTFGEMDCTPLSLLFPSLNVLRLSRPLEAANRCPHLTREWAALENEVLASEVSARLRSCQEFASLHGEAGLQAFMAQQWALRTRDENRHQIQSSVRSDSPDEKSLEMLNSMAEAALFLELAHDLDEKEMELQKDYQKLNLLEDNFRKVLGMEDEDVLDDMAETLDLSLQREKSHLPFLLPRRISSWFRLVLPRLGNASPALVTAQREVVETLADVAQAVCAQKGAAFEPHEISLAPLPLDLSEQGTEWEILDWARNLSEIKEFWKAMEAMVQIWPGKDFQGEMETLIEKTWLTFKGRWTYRIPQKATHTLKTSIVRFTHCSMADLWNFWDKNGFQSLAGTGNAATHQTLILVYDLEAI